MRFKLITIKIIKYGLVSCVGLMLLSACELLQLQFPAPSSAEVQSVELSEEPIPALEATKADEFAIETPTSLRTTDGESVVTLLRYSRFITELNEQDLQAEFDKMNAVNQMENTGRGMLKLAVLLSLPKSTFYNNERAEKLLSKFIEGNKQNTAALREYAHMLLASLKEREGFRKKYNDLEDRLKNERDQRKQLQDKLDALKSIEKSISKRQNDEGVAKP